MGDFAEARRKLIAKIEGCEETHKYMQHKHLYDRNVNPDNYYRLNVDVGVGEFGMNEWNRLADISTNTRRYLAGAEVQRMTQDAARKLAAINRATIRWNRALGGQSEGRLSFEGEIEELAHLNLNPQQPAPPTVAGAFELDGGDVPAHLQHPHNPGLLSPTYQTPSADDKFVVAADEPATYSTRPQSGYYSPYDHSPRVSGEHTYQPYSRQDFGNPQASELDNSSYGGAANYPPPIPPKTPIQGHAAPRRNSPRTSPQQGGGVPLPYPVNDGPPPIINLARKPELR